MREILKWKPEYSVKVELIDKQHYKFHEMLNEFYNAFVEGKDRDMMKPMLTDLIDYAIYHFDTEEKFFEKYNYKEAEEHHQIHEGLKATLAEFMTKYKAGEADISMDLLTFLIDWYIQHLTIEDQKYVELLAGKTLD